MAGVWVWRCSLLPSRKSGYSQWKAVQAPWFWDKNQFVSQPYQPLGDGLPSNACNVLVCMDKDRILTGNLLRAGFQQRHQFLEFCARRDYARKNNSLYGAAARKTAIPPQGDARLLSEDFVSALAGNGKDIFVGFRTQGVDVLDADTMKVKKRLRKGLEGTHIPDLLVLGDGSVLAGTYGGGLVMVQAGVSSYNLDAPEREKEPGFPRRRRMEESAKVLKSLEDLGRRGDKGEKYCFQGRGLVHQG